EEKAESFTGTPCSTRGCDESPVGCKESHRGEREIWLERQSTFSPSRINAACAGKQARRRLKSSLKNKTLNVQRLTPKSETASLRQVGIFNVRKFQNLLRTGEGSEKSSR